MDCTHENLNLESVTFSNVRISWRWQTVHDYIWPKVSNLYDTSNNSLFTQMISNWSQLQTKTSFTDKIPQNKNVISMQGFPWAHVAAVTSQIPNLLAISCSKRDNKNKKSASLQPAPSLLTAKVPWWRMMIRLQTLNVHKPSLTEASAVSALKS